MIRDDALDHVLGAMLIALAAGWATSFVAAAGLAGYALGLHVVLPALRAAGWPA